MEPAERRGNVLELAHTLSATDGQPFGGCNQMCSQDGVDQGGSVEMRCNRVYENVEILLNI